MNFSNLKAVGIKTLLIYVGSGMIILAAAVFLIIQVRHMNSGPVVIPVDETTKKAVNTYKLDIEALQKLDTPTLREEIKKRDAALKAARREADALATQEAEDAWVRAMETLTQRPDR